MVYLFVGLLVVYLALATIIVFTCLILPYHPVLDRATDVLLLGATIVGAALVGLLITAGISVLVGG